jgi:hypothetical protein
MKMIKVAQYPYIVSFRIETGALEWVNEVLPYSDDDTTNPVIRYSSHSFAFRHRLHAIWFMLLWGDGIPYSEDSDY